MPRKSVAVLILLGLILACAPAVAQDTQTEKTFPLSRDSGTAENELDLEEEEVEVWEKQVQKGGLEISFGMGMLDLASTLLAHDQIIYKYAQEATYWGDVELVGETAFAPVIRLGYALTSWLTFEGTACLSFSEYTSSITNRNRRKNEPGASVDFEEPALGEFDPERRSLVTFNGGFNGLIYPLNISGNSARMINPYLTGGFGRIWYDMNSQYTDGAAGTNDMNFGGGLRLLGDKKISIRLEFLYHKNSIAFTPPEYFEERDQGTTLVPLEAHPIVDDRILDQQVTSYSSQDVTSMNWSLGIQGTF